MKYLLTLLLAIFSINAIANTKNLYQVKSRLPNLKYVYAKYIQYHDSGKYEAQQNNVVDKAINYLNARVKPDDKKLAIVFDIDETLLSNWPIDKKYWNMTDREFNDWAIQGKDNVMKPAFRLYQAALKDHVTIFLITARDSKLRKATIENLKNQKITGYKALYLKPEFPKQNSAAFKTALRKKITDEGYTIIINIGDQYSDVCGGFSERTYKLPNPYYYTGGCDETYLKSHA